MIKANREHREPRVLRSTPWVIAGLLLASAVIAWGHTRWWPMQVDAGWYSYPGYALSQGRDPGENMLPPAKLPIDKPGIRSLFEWENRSFLLVRLHSAWFSLAGHGDASLAVFGLLMWLGVTAGTAAAVWTISRNKWATGAAGLAALSDVTVVRESMADLRPDIPIALAVVTALCCLLWYLRRNSLAAAVSCTVSFALPALIHTTGVIPLSVLLAYAALCFLTSFRRSPTTAVPLLLFVGAGLAIVALRQPIMDVLVPTNVPLSYEQVGRHAMMDRWQEMLRSGLVFKAKHELLRWSGYFSPGNIPQFVYLLGGLSGLALQAKGATETPPSRALLFSWLAGVAVISLFDPHYVSTHLVPLVCLGYIAAGAGWALWLKRYAERDSPRVLVCLALLGAFALIPKVAKAAQLVYKGTSQGPSRAAVRELLGRAVPVTSTPIWALAPTSLWLYLPDAANVILDDQRSNSGFAKSQTWNRISVLIIDADFLRQHDWQREITAGIACNNLKPIGRVGQPDGIYYLDAYQVLHNPNCPMEQ